MWVTCPHCRLHALHPQLRWVALKICPLCRPHGRLHLTISEASTLRIRCPLHSLLSPSNMTFENRLSQRLHSRLRQPNLRLCGIFLLCRPHAQHPPLTWTVFAISHRCHQLDRPRSLRQESHGIYLLYQLRNPLLRSKSASCRIYQLYQLQMQIPQRK